MRKVRKDTKGRPLHCGEIYRKSKGLYCYSYIDPLGKRRYLYAHGLDELREKEKRVKKDTLDGINKYAFAQSDINFAFDRYISTRTTLRGSTLSNYLRTYDRHVRETFGKRKLAEVNYSDVLLYYNSLLNEKKLSLSTIDTVHILLYSTFEMAVRDSVIRLNPTRSVMRELKKKVEGRPEPRHALTIEQERAFLQFVQKEEYARWKPLFTVMFGTGCRIGEILGLRWKDIDFKNNTISINHCLTYYPKTDKDYRCEYAIHRTKTESGTRVIPMLEKVKEAFLEEKEIQERTGHHCIAEIDGMKDFVFCNRFGGLLNCESVNTVIKRIVGDHNASEEIIAVREGREPVIIPMFSCHITRHTFCTRLCENETNIKVIQYVMGHKDIKTTMNIYAEVTESKKQEIFKQLNSENIF